MVDFTIITVAYNAESTISETMHSVLNQVDVSFEYLIIDGLSSDNTVGVVESINDTRVSLFSEKDAGLYDAMNKGIAKAHGKYVAIINSDDVYISNDILSKVKQNMENNNLDILSGNIFFFDTDISKKERKFHASAMVDKKQWRSGWQPPHPSTFVKLSVYEKIGTYSLKYKISADYDFLFRSLFKNDYKFGILNEYLIAMRMGGESTKNISSIVQGNKEVWRVWGDNGEKAPRLLIVKKLISKLRMK